MRKQQYRVSESKISIHAPAEGVTSPKKDNDAGRNISIHAPAEGATRRPVGKWRCKKISIHAPAEGATSSRSADHHSVIISIHAPTEGATFCRRFSSSIRLQFQSTLPRRERHMRPCFSKLHPDFNPRSRGGSDVSFFRSGDTIDYFNPRSRGGSDRHFQKIRPVTRDFNPRSRGGSDHSFQAKINLGVCETPDPA